MQFDEGCEGVVYLAFRASLQDGEPQALSTCRFLHVANDALGIHVIRVHQQGDNLRVGDQLGQQFETLGRQLNIDVAEAGEVAIRPRQTGDKAEPNRVADASEDDRDR